MKILLTLTLFAGLYDIAAAQSYPALSALFDNNRKVVKLRWQHTDKFVSAYVIQRSTDNIFYADLSTKRTGDASSGDLFKYTDTNTLSGKQYYRLKIFREGAFTLTPPILVLPGNHENGWLIYPVPVGAVLNLQYKGSDALPGVVSVIIQSINSGTIFTRLRVGSNTRLIQIPVANIGKGIYDIRVYLDNEVVWSNRFSK